MMNTEAGKNGPSYLFIVLNSFVKCSIYFYKADKKTIIIILVNKTNIRLCLIIQYYFVKLFDLCEKGLI